MKFSLRPTSKTYWHDTFVFALVIKPRKKLIYNLQSVLYVFWWNLSTYIQHIQQTNKISISNLFVSINWIVSRFWKRIGNFLYYQSIFWVSKRCFSSKLIYGNVYIDWHLSVVHFYNVYLHFYCSIIKELQKGRILWRCK